MMAPDRKTSFMKCSFGLSHHVFKTKPALSWLVPCYIQGQLIVLTLAMMWVFAKSDDNSVSYSFFYWFLMHFVNCNSYLICIRHKGVLDNHTNKQL